MEKAGTNPEKMEIPVGFDPTGFLASAGAEGFEPSTKVLETHVLPLHHAPTGNGMIIRKRHAVVKQKLHPFVRFTGVYRYLFGIVSAAVPYLNYRPDPLLRLSSYSFSSARTMQASMESSFPLRTSYPILTSRA